MTNYVISGTFLTRQIAQLILTLSFCLFVHLAFSQEIPNNTSYLNSETIINNYKILFSKERMKNVGFAFGIGMVTANSNIDNLVQKWYQDDVRNSRSDDIAKGFKIIGEQKYLLPLTFFSAGIKYFDITSPIGNWGTYSALAYLTGGPPLLLMQATTGGSRPGETDHRSRWQPYNDNNGVSGHAFIGAVPFITLAKMNNDNKPLKYLALAASTATTWSRINDNAHYLSQAILGWYLAWESVDITFNTKKRTQSVTVRPTINPNSYGLSAIYHW